MDLFCPDWHCDYYTGVLYVDGIAQLNTEFKMHEFLGDFYWESVTRH